MRVLRRSGLFSTGTLQVRRILTRIPATLSGKKHVYIEAEPKTQQSRLFALLHRLLHLGGMPGNKKPQAALEAA